MRTFAKKSLKDRQAVVEIFSGDSAVYLFSITAQQIVLKKIDKNAFDKLTTKCASYISQPSFLNGNFSSFVEISHSLYQLIFQNNALPSGRIIISPDGKYFPFEALVTSTQPLRYFLDDYAVSYTYSARYLLKIV